MNKQRHILFIIDILWGFGGTERHLYYLVKGLMRKGFKCTIVTFKGNEEFLDHLRREGIRVIHLPLEKTLSIKGFSVARRICELIQKESVDVVQTYHFMSDTFGVLIGKICGVKKIISSRRDMGDKKKNKHLLFNRFCNRFVSNFIAVCERVADRISQKEGVSKNIIKVIYNGVDYNYFKPLSESEVNLARKELGIHNGDFVVGVISHFRPEKGYDVFYEAVRDLKNTVPNIRFFAVGDCVEIRKEREKISDMGISDVLTLTGSVDDVRKYIGILDVACLVPVSNEGFSNSLLEEMAMGKSIVATDVGGNREAIQAGVNGLLIRPGSPEEIVESILYYYNNPEVRRETGRNNIRKVKEQFSIDAMVDSHVALYAE